MLGIESQTREHTTFVSQVCLKQHDWSMCEERMPDTFFTVSAPVVNDSPKVHWALPVLITLLAVIAFVGVIWGVRLYRRKQKKDWRKLDETN